MSARRSPFSRREFLKGGGALDRRLQHGGAAACRRAAARGDRRRPARSATRSTRGSRSTPTTPRRSISASASSARATRTGAAADRRRRAGPRHEPAHGGAARHQRDAEPGRDQSRARRSSAAARRCARRPPKRARRCCTRAADRLGVPAGQPHRVERRRVGRRRARRRRSNMATLLGDKPFNVKFTGTAPQKPPSRYTARRHARAARSTCRTRSAGKYVYMQHVRVPGMLHGRVVRPRGQGAYRRGRQAAERRRELDRGHSRRARRAQGRLHRRRRAEANGTPSSRRAQLKVTWRTTPRAARQRRASTSRCAPTKTTDTVIAEKGDVAAAASRGAAHVRRATYRGPYQGHLPFGAQLRRRRRHAGRRLVHVLDAGRLRHARRSWRRCSGCRPDKVRVQYYEGAGTFGRSCYDDAAQAAAIMSQDVGQAGARAVHALGRAWLGQLRARASGRCARRRRRERQDRRLRISRLAAWLVDRPRPCTTARRWHAGRRARRRHATRSPSIR